METPAQIEMTVPKSRREMAWGGFFSLVIFAFSCLALINLAHQSSVIPSVIWLLFVAWILWSGTRKLGVRGSLADWLATFAGRRFILYSPEQAGQGCLRFGFEMFGQRFYQKDVPLGCIESVKWSPGQATGMAGRDMNDWTVALWYFQDSPEHRDVHIVGPLRRKEDTAALGDELVSFLSGVGVTLFRGEDDNVFVRPGDDRLEV